ncbi:MAG: hypothetical protein ACJ71N_10590 [Terriglobales bacterium]
MVKGKPQSNDNASDRWLDVEEVRLIADLRVMHSKVDELYQVVTNLKRRHDDHAIHKYADQPVLSEDIDRVDELYMWFLRLKEQNRRNVR